MVTRVQAPDSNAYDVLGVAPGDSAKQIDDAFHQLIEEGGYRAGVPLRGQWLRARQIKEAYATIGDPGKRRAYDELLKEGSERPLWSAVSQNDPTEAAMVRPLSEWQPPPEPAIRPATKATGSGDRDGERVLAPATAIESDNGEIATYFDESATSPEEDTGPTDVDYGPAKLCGIAGAVTLALGSLFYFTWPSGQLQLPATDMAAQLPEGAPQANAAAARPETLAKLPPALEAEELFGEVQPWGPGDTPRVPASLGVSSGTPVATETAAPPPAPTELVVATETQTPPGPDAATATARGIHDGAGRGPRISGADLDGSRRGTNDRPGACGPCTGSRSRGRSRGRSTHAPRSQQPGKMDCWRPDAIGQSPWPLCRKRDRAVHRPGKWARFELWSGTEQWRCRFGRIHLSPR